MFSLHCCTPGRAEELEHAEKITILSTAVRDLFLADGPTEVSQAIDQATLALLDAPLGQNYDSDVQTQAVDELQMLHGLDSLITEDALVTLSVGGALLFDFELAWPD